MKTRSGFVSNSSTASFVVFGWDKAESQKMWEEEVGFSIQQGRLTLESIQKSLPPELVKELGINWYGGDDYDLTDPEAFKKAIIKNGTHEDALQRLILGDNPLSLLLDDGDFYLGIHRGTGSSGYYEENHISWEDMQKLIKWWEYESTFEPQLPPPSIYAVEVQR